MELAAAAAKSLQSCLTLCNPIDGSPPGSPVPGTLQARTLEWVAISFSNAWKWKVKVKSLSHVWLFTTPWTAAFQAPLSMGFSRQQYWSGLPLPAPGDLPNPGIEPRSPALQTDALPSEPSRKPSYSRLFSSNSAPRTERQTAQIDHSTFPKCKANVPVCVCIPLNNQPVFLFP